jgi:hypothetical protein
MLSKYLSGAALVLAAGLLCSPASAAPVGNVTGLHTPSTSNVEQAAYRRCWRSHGRLVCRYRQYGYAADPYYDSYPYYGYGYGPAIGFSFGGGRHHGGGHGFHGGHGGHHR